MVQRSSFWREILKVWLQWGAVGLAAIPSGIVLALLLKKGLTQLEARGVAIALGAILAIVFWNLIERKFAVHPQVYAVGFSSNVFQVEFTDQSARTAPVFATVVLCISIPAYSALSSMPTALTLTPVQVDAISQI
jgi:hypothetical protein